MRFRGWLWGLVAAAVVASLPAAVQRWEMEAASRDVELVADFDDLYRLAMRAGLSARDLLARWRQAGVTSVAIFPHILDDAPSGEAPFLPGLDLDEFELRDAPPATASTALAEARALGLRPVWRLSNEAVQGRPAEAVRAAGIDGLAGALIIFAGTEAVGYPDRLAETAALAVEHDWMLGWVEFGPQDGLAELVSMLGGRAVRVHAISGRELPRLTPRTAVERMVRAVRERGVRVLYLRPGFTGPAWGGAAAAVAVNEQYVADLARRLGDEGFHLGPARPLYPDGWSGSLFAFVVLTAGVAAAGTLMLAGLWPGFRRWRAGWLLSVLVPPVALTVLYAGEQAIFSRQVAAFGATLVFPILAVLTAVERVQKGTLGDLFAGLAAALAVASAGASILVGLLADYQFLLGSAQYLGVKAAHAVPVLAWVTLAVVRGRTSRDRWPWQLSPSPARWWHVGLGAALFLGLTLAFAVYVLRTGNDLVPVSPWELRLRTWLEASLPARPRTKELFLGYPALLAGLALVWGWMPGRSRPAPSGEGWQRWGWLLLAAGIVAPVSLLNTFAHAHSPLAISVARGALGAGFGLAIGASALALVHLVTVAAARRARATGAGVGGSAGVGSSL